MDTSNTMFVYFVIVSNIDTLFYRLITPLSCIWSTLKDNSWTTLDKIEQLKKYNPQ